MLFRSDADLIGFPLRVVVGDKNLPKVEVKARVEKESRLVDASAAAAELAAIVRKELAGLNA